MKFVFFSAMLLSFNSVAMLKKASIDGELSHRYDENYEETQRGLASQAEEAQDSRLQQHESQRKPSSQEKSFDQMNENRIRYWKY